MARRKIRKHFQFSGFGFPVTIDNCPMLWAFGEWVPEVDFTALESAMVIAVALKPVRLSGAEVRFLRVHLGMPMQELADQLGVTRQAVAKWEKRGLRSTDMAWTSEKDIRLSALSRADVDGDQFLEAFAHLRPTPQLAGEQEHYEVTLGELKDRIALIKRKLRRLGGKSMASRRPHSA